MRPNVSLGSISFTSIEKVSLTGGAGADTIDASGYTLGSVTLNGGGNDTINASAVTLATFAVAMIGTTGNDTLNGQTGADSIYGAAGSDSLTFDAADPIQSQDGTFAFDFNSLIAGCP